MILDPQKIATREKLILTGLYLAKYDAAGLKKLGFESFGEGVQRHRIRDGITACVHKKLPR